MLAVGGGDGHGGGLLIHAHRGWDALVALLGEGVQGLVCSDRWSAYGRLSPFCRQVCWAHLKRDFQKLVDRGGTFGRRALQNHLDAEGREFERWLEAGRGCADTKAAAFCANLLALLPAVWRFLMTEGIEPTNNHAERLLRRGVLWRKNAFGSASERGLRFVERLLTVVQTLRLQGRPVLEFLHQALVAHRNGLPAPKLLPVG